jgi:hypothetical protein
LEFGELAVIAVGLRGNAFKFGDLRQCNIHVCILSINVVVKMRAIASTIIVADGE